MSDDRRAIAALLLVVQSGLALLAALGLFAFAKFSNATAALAGQELLAFGGPLVLLLLSLGVARGSRLSRVCVYVWEAVTILGNAFSVLASEGSALTLTTGLTGLALPAAIVFLLKTQNATTRKGLTIGLLLLTGLIHLGLAPEHMTEPPKLGGLFLLDGAAFIVAAIAVAKGAGRWRLPTVVLLVATILAYVVVVLKGQESVDDLGIATKAIELLALGLVVWPCTVRLSWHWLMASASLLFAIVLSGGLAWAATLRPGPAGHTHSHVIAGGKVVLTAAPPNDEQRAVAAKLIEDTRAGIERYADVRVALADGYVPSTPDEAPTAHYMNPKYVKDGVVLDPARPQALVYATTPSGPLLLGAMYMMPKANIAPPDFGGSLAEWHTHSNLCFSLPKFGIDGMQSPFGTCPVGSLNGPTPAMLHVWTVPNPAGPFDDLSPAYVAKLTRGGT